MVFPVARASGRVRLGILADGAVEEMSNPSAVYVLHFETTSAQPAEASVRAVCLAIIEQRSEGDQIIWTVAATEGQGMAFRRIPWVIKPQRRGVMQLEEDEYIYRDRKSGEVLSVSIEALEG